jgi:small conductance mechanosensitive channel
MPTFVDKMIELIGTYGLKVLGAIVILVVGYLLAKTVKQVITKVLTKSKIEPTLISFASHLSYIAILTFVFLAVLNTLGVATTSFVAVIGAAGLAVGLALQGSLANFASGVLLILFRPVKVGDYIEGAGVAGTVEEIQIFATKLATPDNKTIIIPNAKLTGDNITNYSSKGTRRVDMTIGISYDADIDKARKIVADILAKDERVLEEPETAIFVSELADSSVNFTVRPWTNVADYWGVRFDTLEAVKKAFDKAGVGIPFPQRDVHIYQHSE